AHHNLGHHLARAGRTAEAQRCYQAALAVGDRLAIDVAGAAETERFRIRRGNTYHDLGILRARAGATREAEKLLRQASTIRAGLADDFPANADHASGAGLTLVWQGAVLRDLGQVEESARVFRKAARRQGEALRLRPTDPVFRKLYGNHQGQLAHTL